MTGLDRAVAEVLRAKAALEAERAAVEAQAKPIVDGLSRFAEWCRRLYGLGIPYDFDGGKQDGLTVQVDHGEFDRLTIYVTNDGWREDRQSLVLDPARLEDFIALLRKVAEPLRGVDCRGDWERDE